MKYKSTIYRQIVIKITVPVILALSLFAVLNFDHTKNMLVESSKQKSELISDEIHHIFKFKELALEDLEENLESEMERLSNRLVNYYFSNTDSIAYANLDSIRLILGVDTSEVDLYVIDTNGTVINTTMKSDLNLSLYSFGKEFTSFIQERFDDRNFYCSRFGIEIKTNQLKKYSYEKTEDGKYLIEIGHYSNRADEIITTFNARLDSISDKQESILDVELFVDDHNPLTLNKAKHLPEIHREVLAQTFKDGNTHTLVEFEEGTKLHYEYIYSLDEGEAKEFGSVVRIKSNKSIEEQLLRNAFFKTLFIFGGTIAALIGLLFLNARSITKPIKDLVKKIEFIAQGNYKERLDVRASDDVTEIAHIINELLDKIATGREALDEKEEILSDREGKLKRTSEGVDDSIVFANRIQQALLPAKEQVKEIFPDSLIYYNPKKVVSGDFYWIEETETHKFFAVVDCTGHGVMGAFVSLVGLNALNRAIREFGKSDPVEIFIKVNELVERSFKNKEYDREDEMEISLCVLEKKTGLLRFGGAGNSVYVTRKEANGNLIIDNAWKESILKKDEYLFYEIKGDRKPVGKMDDDEIPWKSHNIEVKKGDVIYMSTDGIANQFGGPEGKKFKWGQLRELIISMQNDDFLSQNDTIQKRIEEWLNQNEDQEQMDDMCLIGIRIS